MLIAREWILTEGRPVCRPFLLCLLIGAGSITAQTDPLIQGVVIEYPPCDDEILIPSASSNILPDTSSPVGVGLLRFYGCTTCHDLWIPPFRGRWGPDLDTVGSKLSRQGILDLLSDPRQVRDDSRMPRVPMSDSARTAIADFLVTLTVDLPPIPADVTGRTGQELYERGDCKSCHKLGGKGGDRGPSLAGIERRIRPEWLVAYLMAPSRMVSNTKMPLFELEAREAQEMAVYLVGRGPGGSRERGVGSDQMTGVSSAAQSGCFQCHAVQKVVKPLDIPDPGASLAFVTHHASESASIRIPLESAQVEAMRKAMHGSRPTEVSDREFLEAFWKTPIGLQGTAPSAHDSLSADLRPTACGNCHVKQVEEWQTSLHAAAMGPGVIGQLLDGSYADAAFVEGCQSCHAPNAEQHASLPTARGHELNYQFDSSMRSEGITCLACHVRAHTRLGPPISDQPPAHVWRGPGHGGAHESSVFQQSDFCSHCHQFGEDDRRMNGVLLQDTFSEWEGSPQAREGKTCQTCHMPGRAHTWLGIHDSLTVASAVEISVTPERSGDSLQASVRIRNTGAGHHLPTYVTPKILVTLTLVDGAGLPIPHSRQDRAIGREIVLNSEESREVYDARIPAGGSWSWTYTTAKNAEAEGVSVVLTVYPDHFYTRFFHEYDTSHLSAEAATAINRARQKTSTSAYLLMEKVYPLPSDR